MEDVVVIGGGWAGCSAALNAAKAGAKVVLLERTDMLLGTGLVGGIMRNNGRFTAAEEMIEMGAGELFEICDQNSRHRNIDFPGHKHANLYDVAKVGAVVRKCLQDNGVVIETQCRISSIKTKGTSIKAVVSQDGRVFEGKVFVDATGTAGPMNNCTKHGNGCAMCILRCPTFGGRVSVVSLCGIEEIKGRRPDGNIGAMSGSCKLHKDSLSKEIKENLNNDGVSVIPIPEEFRKADLSKKACQQYALTEFSENIVLLDTGHAKMMTSHFNLEYLRQIPGFENARFEDPYSGGVGNSMRYFAIAPRDNSLKVKGVKNLFCAGEKCGTMVGHTEAICTGALAGHNSARFASGKELINLPETLAVGDMIAFVNKQMKTKEGQSKKYTFSGSVYFERMKEKSLYSIDKAEIKKRVRLSGLQGVLSI